MGPQAKRRWRQGRLADKGYPFDPRIHRRRGPARDYPLSGPPEVGDDDEAHV
jgi:hypothetical protein